MSCVRMRVANSDWCASRSVVSVTSTRRSARIQRAKPSAPSSRSWSRVPLGTGAPMSQAGFCGLARGCTGRLRPFISGLPLTITSPMNCSSLVARSRRGWKRNSSGVSSMKRVVHSPERNCGCAITFSRNCRLVDTPRTRNSRSARSIREIASSGVCPHEVTFTSSES